MLKFCLPFVALSMLLAQNPPPSAARAAPESSEPAPPEVDAALRARVTQFYQDEVEEKFRQAEQLIAEDSKDFFYTSVKPSYASFEIRNILYSDNFTKATVYLAVDRVMAVPGFEGRPIRQVMPSRWKLENGQWCWYVDPRDLRNSPFGITAPPRGPNLPGGGAAMPFPGSSTTMPVPGSGGTVPGAGGPAPAPMAAGTAPAAGLPPMPNMTPRVQPDKTSVELITGMPSAGQVTLLNKTPWPLSLSVKDAGIPGLSAKLDQTSVKAGEKATLQVQSSGNAQPPKDPVVFRVVVQQTNQVIPIKISFLAPIKK